MSLAADVTTIVKESVIHAQNDGQGFQEIIDLLIGVHSRQLRCPFCSGVTCERRGALVNATSMARVSTGKGGWTVLSSVSIREDLIKQVFCKRDASGCGARRERSLAAVQVRLGIALNDMIRCDDGDSNVITFSRTEIPHSYLYSGLNFTKSRREISRPLVLFR
ncbi:unnamed protein product [Hermetia illucens]|uniref:Uncharacterized protein n=1 Tax=Hermetia illucens TaxID=343691 RepID=A0A7R8UEM5_HERIL|nr:unnamed protein product [Hermetia illucens]